MRARSLVLFACAALPAAAQRTPPRIPIIPPVTFRDSVIRAEQIFVTRWDSIWRFSERDRHGMSVYDDAAVTVDGSRHQNYHCHPDVRTQRGPSAQGRLIMTANNGVFAVCPSFDLGEVRTNIEEARDIDASLTDARRPLARAARDTLIALLDSAVRRLPGDDFLAGQRVRFLVDQWSVDSALAAVTSCKATKWWCSALAGYVFTARREPASADSAFRMAFATMSSSVKCRWNDLRVLIDFEFRDKYEDLACEKRDAVNDTIWWLADPLFIVPGNERKLDQLVRMMQLELRSEFSTSERFSWDPELGGDARRAMIVRYGWPSMMYWGGPLQNRGHSGYLAANHSRPNEAYTTYEYFGTRLHLVPMWNAIADPFHAHPRAWAIDSAASADAAPSKSGPAIVFGRQTRQQPPNYWWPVEHAKSDRRIVQLPNGQQVMLRRFNGALLAAATDLDIARIGIAAGEPLDGITLVTSEGPGQMRTVASKSGVAGSPIELHGMIPATPVVAGIESVPAARTPGVRVRFGATPPPTLSAMAQGEIAISPPVFLRVPANGAALPIETDAALPLMATSRAVDAAGKLGVYWETYGMRSSDSVEVAVWIERSTGQSIVRRFGNALGVTTDLNTPVAVSWREPDPSRRTHIVSDGAVPIVARSVILDASNIPPGEYRLEIAVRRQRQPEVRSAATFTVR